MAATTGDELPELNLREQIARIDKMRAETEKTLEEVHKLVAETFQIRRTADKLAAEAVQIERTTKLEPWRIYAAAAASAVALFGAAAAFVKLVL